MKTESKAHSPADLAKFWGCSRKTILRIIARGDLPAVRLSPQTIRILAVDAAAFYAKHSAGLSTVAPVAPVGTADKRPIPCGRPWGS